MNIVVTNAAAAQLLEQLRPKKEIIRIDARVRGGCGISVELAVLFDEPRRNDRIIRCREGIDIYLDRFTERSLPAQTKIDYNQTKFTVTGLFDSNE